MSRGAYSSANYFSLASATLITAFPFTMACWFRPSTLTACAILGYGETTTSNNRWSLEMNASGNARCSTTSGGTFIGFNSSNAISAGSWAHFCAVWASATDRRVFLNGTKATNTSSVGFSTNAAWQWRCGERPLNITAPADGWIADRTIWNLALADDDVTSLASRARHLRIRPAGVVAYAPMVNDERDLVGPAWTENGTVPVQDHPRII